MKTYPPSPLLLALSGLAALSAAGCSDSKSGANSAGASAVPSNRATGAVSPAASTGALPPLATPPSPQPAAPAAWSDIQGLGYDDRTDFVVGLGRLHASLDQRIAVLKARRATLTAAQDTQAGDAAIEVLGTARTRLLSASTDMGKATSENWDQRRERVGDAWVNVQNLYDKADATIPR